MHALEGAPRLQIHTSEGVVTEEACPKRSHWVQADSLRCELKETSALKRLRLPKIFAVLPDHKMIHGAMCFYVPRQLLHVITLTWQSLMDLTHYHAARTPRSLPTLAVRHVYLNALL